MTDEPVSIPQGISFGIGVFSGIPVPYKKTLQTLNGVLNRDQRIPPPGVFRGRERDDYIIFPRISLLLLMKLVILSGVRVP